MKTFTTDKARSNLGFSLLELMVVMVLVALLMVIAIPAIRSISQADVKGEIMRLAGLTSEVYARAAVSGINHRISFDLEEGSYWVEEKAQEAGEFSPDLGYEELMKELQNQSEENRKKMDQFIPNYKAVSGDLGEKYSLPKSLKLYGVWADNMDAVSRSGKVYVYFFAGGYTQLAFISILEKGDEEASSAMYLSLSPLTGRVEINYGEPETGELLDSERES